MIKMIFGFAAGLLLSFFLPKAADFIIKKKAKKHQKEHPDEPKEYPDVKPTVGGLFFLVLTDAVLSAAIAFLHEPTSAAVIGILMLQCCLTCVITDKYIRIIANEMVLVLLALGIGFRICSGGFSSLLGGLGALALTTLVFGGSAYLMYNMVGTPGVGAGDLKYAMVLALAMGWDDLFWFLGGMAAALIAFIGIGVLRKTITLKTKFPMCLQLTVGFVCAMVLAPIVRLLSAV